MAFSIDMARIRRDSYRVIRQDGLSDICGGLMLGIMAIFLLNFKYAGALIVGCAMQTVILPTCRKKITYRRVGFVKFLGRPDKKSLLVWDVALPLAVVALTICAGIWVRVLLPLYLGVFLAGLTLAAARITRCVLDYVLAGVFLASGVIGQLFVWRGAAPQTTAAFQFWTLAGFLICVGLVQLTHFIRRYPLPVKEKEDEDA